MGNELSVFGKLFAMIVATSVVAAVFSVAYWQFGWPGLAIAVAAYWTVKYRSCQCAK